MLRMFPLILVPGHQCSTKHFYFWTPSRPGNHKRLCNPVQSTTCRGDLMKTHADGSAIASPPIDRSVCMLCHYSCCDVSLPSWRYDMDTLSPSLTLNGPNPIVDFLHKLSVMHSGCFLWCWLEVVEQTAEWCGMPLCRHCNVIWCMM